MNAKKSCLGNTVLDMLRSSPLSEVALALRTFDASNSRRSLVNVSLCLCFDFIFNKVNGFFFFIFLYLFKALHVSCFETSNNVFIGFLTLSD